MLKMFKIDDPNRVHNYEYKCTDLSILTPYMKKYFWSKLLYFIPKLTSANLISFIANTGSTAGFIFIMIFASTENAIEVFSNWWFLIPALGTFFYHTLDNIDGSQARRTKSSSPLGEFLDHWFDAFNSLMLPLGIAVAFSMPDYIVVPLLFASVIAFWGTMWEQRITGEIFLGRVSQVEGVIAVIVIYLVTAFVGPSFWNIKLYGFVLIAYVGLLTIFSYLFIGLAPLIRVKKKAYEMLGVIATLLLLIAWYYVAKEKGLFQSGEGLFSSGKDYSLYIFAILVGLVGAKHIGDIQRSRLIATHYNFIDWSFLFAGALLLGSLFIEGFVNWRVQSVLFAFYFILVAIHLLIQFFHTSSYIRKELGINLFSLTDEQKKAIE